MNGMQFREFLLYSEFDFDKDLDAWRGKNGLTISNQFIIDLDDYHTSHAIDQLADAVGKGASKVTAHVISTKPTRIQVLWD